MLDASGAYDNVSHDRLLHNIKKRRLGHFVPWVKAFLTNRSTKIRMPEGTSDQILTPTDIPQGSPISPILYLIYNADLIESCGNGVTSNGWVDDVCWPKEIANARPLRNSGRHVAKLTNGPRNMHQSSTQRSMHSYIL